MSDFPTDDHHETHEEYLERLSEAEVSRTGDEVRIKEIIMGEHRKGLLCDVISAGCVLAASLGLSYKHALADRMAEATSRLGPWDVRDGRDYRMEALEELLDAACYLAAEKVREEKA